MDCSNVSPPISPPEDCDLNIKGIAAEVCGECDVCDQTQFTESCEFDVCFSPGVKDQWNANNEAEARVEAQKIADEYCELEAELIEQFPSRCRDDATKRPTDFPLPFPTRSPSNPPTYLPSPNPTRVPTRKPTELPSETPTEPPTATPTVNPTYDPSRQPTDLPSPKPTPVPTEPPSSPPTRKPTAIPTTNPTRGPTARPTSYPTSGPTPFPTYLPTKQPTWGPTDYQHCAYMAHEFQSCKLDLGDYVTIDDFDESDFSESGLQYCAELCFREGSNWLQYATDSCRCILGLCKSPLVSASITSVYRILPCSLECDYISSEEWWGQSPTATEHLNGVISPKPAKGLRFTSEIYAEIYMLGIEMVLDADNSLEDRTLVVAPKLYLTGENRTLATGEAELPAFIDGYDGQFGGMSKVFLTGRITATVPYTIAFEFISGEVDVMVSTNTHYYHDGEIAQDVFGVKGTAGSEPDIVDTNAPHVVICYLELECVQRVTVLDDSVTEAKCPDGYGGNSKLKEHAYDCSGLTFVDFLIKQAIANEFYDDCTSMCIFDTDWPLILNFIFDQANTCWNTLVQADGCEVFFPDVAEEMFERADLFCTQDPFWTPIPTVAPTDHEKCNQTEINDGSHVLLSIDSAYEILTDICSKISANDIALLDGGYIYGSSCTAEKTDEDKPYTLMYCATTTDYCDFKDLLLSPNFEVDPDTTLILVKLSDMLLNFWLTDEWGFEVTMLRSAEMNAVGLYFNSLASTEFLYFYIENEAGVTITTNPSPLPNGKNSQAHWYFAVLQDASGNGVHLAYGSSYKLLFTFPTEVTVAAAFYIETKIRVYTGVTMPFEVDDLFTVDNLLIGSRDASGLGPGTYTSDPTPDYIPFVNAKFCRDLPTPAPTEFPTAFPTEAPTEPCYNIHFNLLSYDEHLYDVPSWFDIFGGEYKYNDESVNGRFSYDHTVNSNLRLYWTGSEWKVYDTSSEYYFVLTNSGSAAEYFPSLDDTSIWQYENNQPGHDSLTGEVTLYVTCDNTFPPTVSPTTPTEQPTLERDPCAILRVETEEDFPQFRYNGNYYIVNDPDDYVFRNGKNQWYLNGDVRQGHIFWMDDYPHMWEHMWLINTPAGYLGGYSVTDSFQPDSHRYNVYLNGEIASTTDTSANIVCDTEPPSYSPTKGPSDYPSITPTRRPTARPSQPPTGFPTRTPTEIPSHKPTPLPTKYPTKAPSAPPTKSPVSQPTLSPTYEKSCDFFTLSSDDFDQFDGEYVLKYNYGRMDTRNEAPQWVHAEKGYVIYWISDGVFSNRWTIQAVEENNPLVSTQDYYILSPDLGEISGEALNNPPRAAEWQVFSADTWHIIGDFLMTVELECSDVPFPTRAPTRPPTSPPTVYYPCIYLNFTDGEDSSSSWIGVYTRINDPEYKNGKVHYSGPIGNELYWIEDGIFGQRWILTNTNGTVLAYEDAIDSTNIPDKVLWQSIGFDSCLGHCVEFGNDVNITVTYLDACVNTSVPTSSPSPRPTTIPTDEPTILPTKSPTSSPSLMPSVIPTPSPTKLPSTAIPTSSPSLMPSPPPTASPSTTTEPTEHPTYAPTESPTVYPTEECYCLSVSTPSDEISRLFTMIDYRNGRNQWEDGETGWSLYYVEDGLFSGTWAFQGDSHEYYYVISAREGDAFPPFSERWQRFTTAGYNLGSDEYVTVSLDCVPCEDTTTPTETPTSAPTNSPTLSPTCEENYIIVSGQEIKEFEGLYQRQEQNRNGKPYYISDNGYSIYYVHDGTFDNHWVLHSSDIDYLYMIEQSWEGDEPLIGEESAWNEYSGGRFFVAGNETISLYCWESLYPTTIPTAGSSPLPTSGPTRSPSPSPTIYPTSMPSPKPSLLPSPAPSVMPSVVPSPSPTDLPTTSLPSSSPSLMPSPSPTDYPTTLSPTIESDNPTLMPTSSPSPSPSNWCRCILVVSTNFNGVYMQNGRTYNQHWVWENEYLRKIYWEGEETFSWALEGDGGLLAMFGQVDPNWRNTPPLDSVNWNVSSSGSVIDIESITMTCTTCDPTPSPTSVPSPSPSSMPTPSPTALPTTPLPSPSPSSLPTTSVPSSYPSFMPSPSPSPIPSTLPTPSSTKLPTTSIPTSSPSSMPSPSPSPMPSDLPSPAPSPQPSTLPTTSIPTSSPSSMP